MEAGRMDLTDASRAREYAAWLLLFAAVILLGVIGWLLSLGVGNAWFSIPDVSNLLVAVAGLILTRSVQRSHARVAG